MNSKKTILRVPCNAAVFILEDSGTRLQWFFERLSNARYSSTVEDALPMLSLMGDDAVLFLDHDLHWHDAAGFKPGSGVRVAHYLSRSGFHGRVVVYSVNESGAAEMKRWLPHAELHPFGTFEITLY